MSEIKTGSGAQELRESEGKYRTSTDNIPKFALSPEGESGVLELADLIDAPALQKLMNEFYSVAHIPMSIVDVKGRVLVGVGWQDICARFHREQPESFRHCLESDTVLSSGLAQGEYRLYKCKNNMWQIATPIIVAGEHLGNIFTGQVFFENEAVDMELFRAQAREHGFDEEEYLAALDRVPRMSRKTVDQGMAFLLKLADMLSQLGYSNVKLARLLAERERLTDSLRKSEERLKHAEQIAHLGSWELSLTRDELTWSDEVYRIFGLEPQEFGATYEAFMERVHPDDRAGVHSAYTRSLRENRDTYEIEHRVVRKSTGEIRYIHEKCEHLRDAAGRVIGSVGMVQDITERKQAEDALRASEERLRLFIEHAPASLAMLDREMHYLSVSRRWMSDYNLGNRDLIGLSHYEVFPEVPDHWKTAHHRALQGEIIRSESDRFERADGSVQWLRSEVRPWRDQSGVIAGIVIFSEDITDRKRAGEALQKAHDELELKVEERTAELKATNRALGEYAAKLERLNQDLQEFAYVASHDLQEPLRKIQMFSDLLKEQGSLPEAQKRDYFERMQFAAERMRAMIDALLTYSRVTTRGESFVEVDLSSTVGRALQILDLKVEETGAAVEIGDLPIVEADPGQMEQLFRNLLENALKFCRKDVPPEIKIYSEQSEKRVRIMVEDKGIGFDEKHLERIFIPFERLHGKDDFKGTGIGLAICRKVVERHSGTITAKSRPGKGSTFLIDLPVKQKGENVAE